MSGRRLGSAERHWEEEDYKGGKEEEGFDWRIREGEGTMGGAVVEGLTGGEVRWVVGTDGLEGEKESGSWGSYSSDPHNLSDQQHHPLLTSVTVTSIADHGTHLVVTSEGGREWRTRTAVVTVPVSVLESSVGGGGGGGGEVGRRLTCDITFSPPLSPPKISAIKKFGMDNACKLILIFNDDIIPPRLRGLQGCICVDGHVPTKTTTTTRNNKTDDDDDDDDDGAPPNDDDDISNVSHSIMFPEIWFRRYPSPSSSVGGSGGGGGGGSLFTATSFATSGFADRIGSLPSDDERFRLLREQLGEMFPESRGRIQGGMVDAVFVEWKGEGGVRGGYSYPLYAGDGVAGDEADNTADTVLSISEELRRPEMGGKLFFAGEHGARGRGDGEGRGGEGAG